MTSTVLTYPDNSTLAHFKLWAQAISTWFSTCGWTQGTDTGQVNWSTIASVPAANAYVYEIWEPNDGLTNFYVKIGYGNTPDSSTGSPSVGITIGTGTNGAGTITGIMTARNFGQLVSINTTTYNTTTQYECDFSGAPGRIGVYLWRAGGNCAQFFVIERSNDNTGTPTGAYVTALFGGAYSAYTNNGQTGQQSLVFGVGPTNAPNRNGAYSTYPLLSVRRLGGASSSFAGSIPFDLVAPCVGYFDNPMTMFGVSNVGDLSEGAIFSITLYGATHTYLASNVGTASNIFGNGNGSSCWFGLRWE